MTPHPERTQPPHDVPDAHDEHRLGSSNLAVVLRVLGHRHRLRQRDQWTPQQLQAYQARALRQQRDHAYAHSPFYRCFHAGRTDRPLHELPVLPRPYPQPYAADCMRLTAASSLSDLLSHDS